MTEIVSKVIEGIPQEVQKNLELTSINDDIVWQEHKIGETRFYVVSRKGVNAPDVSKEMNDSLQQQKREQEKEGYSSPSVNPHTA
jgi:dTDP-glucose pyrophosphorylase